MIDEIKEKIRLMGADEAIGELDAWIAAHPEDVEAYTLRGMRHFGAGHRSAAIGDYLTALRLDPENARARQALDYANSILAFYNKDLFNP